MKTVRRIESQLQVLNQLPDHVHRMLVLTSENYGEIGRSSQTSLEKGMEASRPFSGLTME